MTTISETDTRPATWVRRMPRIDEFTHVGRIAYFSMELALESRIPTYSGGLGVLAGDFVRSAADMRVPMVAVTLVSRSGYFRQEITPEGLQIEFPDVWDPASVATPLDAIVAVNIERRKVWVRGWLYSLETEIGYRQPVILLDTELDVNTPEDREITQLLYGRDARYRLMQEMVLGIGGARMLHALGFRILQYHMNEGHSALLSLELLERTSHSAEDTKAGESLYDERAVREMCNFTTHTPVEAGHDKFTYGLVSELFGNETQMSLLKRLGGEESLNMTRLALNLSESVNGVAKKHAEVSRTMFPGYSVQAITNGVHSRTWTAEPFRRLFDGHFPGWWSEPEVLVRADQLPDDQIWQAHTESKEALIARVASTRGVTFRSDLPIFGFARRMTAYKRPDLLFTDLERLRRISKRYPFQLVFAGKAHPNDAGGKELIRQIHIWMSTMAPDIAAAFLPNYDMDTGLILSSGCDVWLNTPLPPLEASGTSGMKAAINGVPSLSILDGWWIEGCIEGVTGWAVGDASVVTNGTDAESLYEKLESAVLPLFYNERERWIAIMKGAISKNAALFNSHRMVRRYVTEVYSQ